MGRMNHARGIQLAGIAVASLSLLLSAVRADDATPPTAGKTGEQLLKFDDRSPLSTPKSLAARMGEKKFEPDYDLKAQEFLTWVPDDYTPAKPHGILLLLNYKETTALPEILPILKQRHLIYIAPKDATPATWVKVGLGLDAVHNLKKFYRIDENRIYVFDFDTSASNGPDNRRASAGHYLAICFAEIFTGSYQNDSIHAWKNIRTADNRIFLAGSPMPPAAQLAIAKTRPMFISHNGEDESRKLRDRFLVSEGFRLTRQKTFNNQQWHYPYFTTDWVTEVLTFLDDNAPKPKPKPVAPAATAPSTTPGVRPATGGSGGVVTPARPAVTPPPPTKLPAK